MKISNIVTAAFCALFISPVVATVNAQPAKSAIVDSVNKQLRQSAKPAKASGTSGALRSSAAASKSNNAAATKPARVVPVPVFTSSSGPAPTKVARVSAASDSSVKTAPPVQRSAKTAKSKPPAK